MLATTANTDYATLIRQTVTEPLGLGDTAIDLSADQRRRIIRATTPMDGQPRRDFGVLAGAGAMYSTAPDMLAGSKRICIRPVHWRPRFNSRTTAPAARDKNQIGLAWMIDPATGTSPTTAAPMATPRTHFST